MNPERRFVFDTNVLVSAFLFRKGIPRAAFDLALSLGIILRSGETLDELWDVLVRPKFDRFLPLSDRITLLRGFEQISHPATVTSQLALCRDPKDDKSLNLALDAKAECITTGDKDLLVLADSFPVPIFTPAQFLAEKQP
ncbi:MAG: putative toxin-antitoxin system toxin component, PIN family [Saprospiraceae bacterium]|nr:MAG: putative toxin-antitoxin system toxin component, PIN family [Saprospiraceae bacterium]